jgi:hypothetical protein
MTQIVNKRKRSRWSDYERHVMLIQLQEGLPLERVSENLGRPTSGIVSQFASMCISQTETIQKLQQQYPHLNISNIISQQQALNDRRGKRRKSKQRPRIVKSVNNQNNKNEEAVLIATSTESLHTVMTQVLEELKQIKTILRGQKSK